MSVSLGGSTLRKRGLRPCPGAVEIDSLKENNVIVHIEIESTATALDKRHRPGLDLRPLTPRLTA